MADVSAHSPEADGRWSASSLIYFAAYICTIINEVIHNTGLGDIANWLMLAFITLEYRKTEIIPKVMSTLLLAIGLLAASTLDMAWDNIWQGVSRTRVFLVLFGSVAWLAVPARESPSLRAIREMVLTQPPGRRFAYLGIAAHGLGLAFNLAGISLLSGMISDKHSPRLKRRLGRAMAHGFALVPCWSPFFVGAVVILAAWPEVKWSQIAPYGVCLAIILWSLSWAMDKLTNPPRPPSANAPVPAKVSGKAWLNTSVVLGCLFTAVILIVEGVDISIPIALGIVGPPLALIWRASFYAPSERRDQSIAFSRRTISGLKNIRSEILLFTAANTMGVGISGLIDPDLITTTVQSFDLAPLAMLLLLSFCYLTLAALGLHPVITIILLSQFLTAELMGISPTIMVLALLALWGLSTNLSPTSATSLYISRLTNESNLTVAWRWNAPFSYAAGIVISILGATLSYFGLM
ncbi:MAG: hypothetical protein HN725_04835 [Alphaproteobacteria bacterium]|jgi:hypothetical protein|nr:hypothetical protein [Alphaproteobacteria bacterium]MBT4083685.1 hypothetical protein [Alphaproteobacteria bacterium]MBT4545207.1 hypothetical protein [Alphaproteobacteria bacterium]MBT7744595.1 hypothetical protein [Alphaproteobacteria bacterium]